MNFLRKKLLITMSSFAILGCHSQSTGPAENLLAAQGFARTPVIDAAEIAHDSCMSLEKLHKILSEAHFRFPSVLITTNQRSLSEMPASHRLFYSHAAFNHQTQPANELALFRNPTQTDCAQVLLQTASNEILTYDIVESSARHLSLRRNPKMREEMPDFKQKSYKTRLQPQAYTITLEPNGQSITLTTRYRTFDVLCAKKKQYEFETTKVIHWAQHENILPREFHVAPEFLARLESATETAAQPPPPAAEAPAPEVPPDLPLPDESTPSPLPEVAALISDSGNPGVTIEQINEIMNRPIKDALKRCHP